MAHVSCSQCGKQVSNEASEELTVRAFVECPECIRRQEVHESVHKVSKGSQALLEAAAHVPVSWPSNLREHVSQWLTTLANLGTGDNRELIHWAHYLDGYPLCWSMDREGDFKATRDVDEVTCPDCIDLST